MPARIYSPAKTAMQSGKTKTGHWVLEFEAEAQRKVEPLMGYTSSSDMRSQIKMNFDTKEAAIEYATREGIVYTVSEPKQAKRRQMSYSDNFSFSRNVPWTH